MVTEVAVDDRVVPAGMKDFCEQKRKRTPVVVDANDRLLRKFLRFDVMHLKRIVERRCERCHVRGLG